jgi:hypothetical protein
MRSEFSDFFLTSSRSISKALPGRGALELLCSIVSPHRYASVLAGKETGKLLYVVMVVVVYYLYYGFHTGKFYHAIRDTTNKILGNSKGD